MIKIKDIELANISRFRGELMGVAMLFIILFHVALPREDAFFGLRRMGNVEKITAESHDFTPTGIKDNVVVEGKNIEEIYNIDGTKASHIVPGKIYIIKSNGKTRKVIK